MHISFIVKYPYVFGFSLREKHRCILSNIDILFDEVIKETK